MKNYLHSLLLVLGVSLFFTGCASGPSMVYRDYVGGSTTSGKGGTKLNVEGMDIWENGAPPRKFKIIGIITDEYPEYEGEIRDSQKKAVRVAREHGGEALILVAAQSRFAGATTDYIGAGYPVGGWHRRGYCGPVFVGGASYGITTPNYERLVKYQVIEFLR